VIYAQWQCTGTIPTPQAKRYHTLQFVSDRSLLLLIPTHVGYCRRLPIKVRLSNTQYSNGFHTAEVDAEVLTKQCPVENLLLWMKNQYRTITTYK